jgi:hypothetical protein
VFPRRPLHANRGLRIADALPLDDDTCPYLFKTCADQLRALKEALAPLSDLQIAAVERAICHSLHAVDSDELLPGRRSSLGTAECVER